MFRKPGARFWSGPAPARPTVIIGFVALASVAAIAGLVISQRAQSPPDTSLTPVDEEGTAEVGQQTFGSDAVTDRAEPLAASALYVDAANGSDGNPGTIDDPILTPAAAFRKTEPGMTVYFRSGVYDDSVLGNNIIRQGGTSDKWLTVRPYPGEEVEIVAGGEYGNGFEVSGASYVEIRDFTITGRDDSTHGNGVTGNEQSHDIRVLNNKISGFGQSGVSFVRSSRVTIEGNEIRNTAARSFWQGSGISLFEAQGPSGPIQDGFTNIVRSNYLVGNYNGVPSRKGLLTDGNCIIVDFFDVETTPVYTGSTLVENNICAENGGRGVHVFFSSNVMVRNNTLVGNGRSRGLSGTPAEMVAVRASDVSFYNNLVLNNPGVQSYFARDAENIVFENNYALFDPPSGPTNRELDSEVAYLGSRSGGQPAAEFAPVPGSELIGASAPANQPAKDLLGRTRPAAGSIGALEPTPNQ